MKGLIYILLLLLPVIVSGQRYTNYYDFRDGSGATLTDAVGGANGTIAGTATAPAWASVNKYLIFTGGNGTSQGDRGRVNFTATTFQYAYNSTFSQVVIYRSSKADANAHSLIRYRDANAATTNYINFNIDASELNTDGVASGNSMVKVNTTASSICDGKWHITVLIYTSNSLISYSDGVLMTVTTNNNMTSGNLYTANAKFTMGAVWYQTAGNYGQDLTGDICRFVNSSGINYTIAEIQNIQNEFNLLIY